VNNMAQTKLRPAFTLIEVLIAIATIGIGITAMLTGIASSTRVNGEGRSITQAAFIAQELREWTVKLPFRDPDPGDADNPPGPDGSDPQAFVDDLDDLMNVVYSPPRDGLGSPITDMANWSQTITLTWRDPENISTTVADGASDVINVQVVIARNGIQVLTTGWVVSRGADE